jgi:Fe-S-cluster-containing dehydrogenase component/formate-dependent nitrite reductase membrane component NrfD
VVCLGHTGDGTDICGRVAGVTTQRIAMDWLDGVLPPGGATLPVVGGPRYAKILDQNRCIGCHACTTACKSENEVPLSVTRTYVKSVDVGVFPEARRAFQVTRCNMCADAPCVTACPTSAMFRRDDGIVDFDKSACIGCRACMAACPYDAIFINPDDHSAEKCNFCAHRIDMGLEPACAVVCPVEAIIVGDLNDPLSRVSQMVNREAVMVRRPEKDTKPKVFYRGAHQATLDPLAARRPDGDVFAWTQQYPEDAHHINAGVPGEPTSSAAALLSYDIGHSVPWDWRVGLYTFTKSVAAGVYLVAALLLVTGHLDAASATWRWMAPTISLGFLAATGAILVWDLEHPARFLYIFLRPQWRSWLVRGGVILSVYGAVLVLHLVGAVAGLDALPRVLLVVGVPAALMAAVYTAFLFAQAKARDLWQNPLLPPHLAVQAVMAGAAALWLSGGPTRPLGVVLAVSCAVHVAMVLGEVTLPHATAHARMAARNLYAGRFRTHFWAGLVLALAAATAPVAGPLAPLACAAALGGLWAFEHAYVQAGQSVPLA